MPRAKAKKKQSNATRSAKTIANRKAYNAKKKQIDARTRRNKARKKAIANGTARKYDNTDVHHSGSDGKGKAKVVSRNYNRKLGGAKGGRRSHGGGRPRKR